MQKPEEEKNIFVTDEGEGCDLGGARSVWLFQHFFGSPQSNKLISTFHICSKVPLWGGGQADPAKPAGLKGNFHIWLNLGLCYQAFELFNIMIWNSFALFISLLNILRSPDPGPMLRMYIVARWSDMWEKKKEKILVFTGGAWGSAFKWDVLVF